MKLNPSKTKTMIVFRSRTMQQQLDDLVIFGVTLDSKMTFEKHLRSVSRAASQRLGILRKSWQVFHDSLLLWSCFRDFAETHLKLLDRVVNGASYLTEECLCVTLTSSICGNIMYSV